MAPAAGTVERRDERIGIAATVTTGFGAVAVLARDVGGLHLVCPLRALTDVPCPGCGMTSVASSLVHGDIVGALTTDPAGVVLVAVVAAVVVLHVGPPVWSERIRPLAAPGAPPARIRSFGAPADRTLAVVAAVALLVHWATVLAG
jgi:hypothetical protein